MKEEFKRFIDKNLISLGYADRAKFIRDAVREKLLAMGKDIPFEWTLPPGRQGKGGRSKFSKEPYRTRLTRTNIQAGTTNSKPLVEDEEILTALEDAAPNPPPKSKRRP